MAENEGRSPAPLETQIKQGFSLEWAKADSADKKKSLMQRIMQRIRDMVTKADESEKNKTETSEKEAKEAKQEAAKSVIEFFQFLTGNVGQVLDPETLKSLPLNESQVSFLQNLGKMNQNQESAGLISQIVKKTIDNPDYLTLSKPGDPTKSQLEQDFEKVKSNERAKHYFILGLTKLAAEGKLKDAEGKNLSIDDVNARFPYVNEESTETNSKSQTEKQNTQNRVEDETEEFNLPPSQQGRGFGRKRNKAEDPVRLARYKDIMDRLRKIDDVQSVELNAKLEANRQAIKDLEEKNLSKEQKQQEYTKLSEEQADLDEESKVHFDQVNEALNYLITGEFTGSPEEKAQIEQFIKDRLNNQDPAYLNEVKAFMQEGTGTLDGTYEGYQDLADKVNSDYTTEAIKTRIIKNGRIDLEAIQRLQADIEDDIGVLFETLYNSPKGSFEESFSSYSEGQMLRKITQHLRVQINRILEEVPRDKRDQFKQIFNDMIISPIQRRPALERIVHQYQQVGATIDLEKLRDILKTYNISSLQEFYNDDLSATINDLMPSFVQHLFIKNGNEMINNFFQLVQEEEEIDSKIVFGKNEGRRSKKFVLKYRQECIDYMHTVINAANRAKGNTDEISKDRINARFSRAYLDNFLLTLRGIKVMSKANPMFEKFGDLPFASLITGIFNPLAGWGKFGHRGRGHQESGDAETTEFSGMNNFAFNEIAAQEYIKKYGDVFDNFHPAEMKKEGDKRVMFQVYPDNKQLMEDLKTGRWDAYYTMDEVYKGMVFGNIIDQQYWPFAGFNKVVLPRLAKELYKKELNELSRQEALELKYRTSGVVTAFWNVEGYASDDTENMFVRYQYNQEIAKEFASRIKTMGRELTEEERKVIKEEIVAKKKYEFSNMDWIKETAKYTKGEKRFDKIFDVKMEGKDSKVAFREYRMHRFNSLKGEVFHQLLLKDPNAWLAEMVQTYPELAKGKVPYTDNNGINHEVTASEFYFNLDAIPDSSIPKDLKVQRDRFRFKILTKFRGKEGDYLSNVPHLKKIMDFYTKLYETESDKDTALLKLSENLTTARQIAVQGSESAIKDNYITDDNIRSLMFDKNDGLITYFNNMVGGDDKEKRKKYFGDGEHDLGEVNGFYQRWSFSKEQDNQSNILPEGDTNMKYLLEVNENPQALDRRLGTDMAFVKAQEVLNKVPSVCKKAADSDNFDSWYGTIEELHKEMAVIADEDQGKEQKYQQLLYQTICNWFSLDSDTEKMFIGFLNQMKLGTDASMANLKSKNMSKFVLDQDSRREYLIRLQDRAYLKGNYDAIGGWGFDTAELVAGVSMAEIFRKQAVYALIGAAIVTVATAIKEGYEEEIDED